MAPIYESDQSEKRWEHDSWRTYEFWEKIELRIRKRKKLWIIATLVLSIGIFSVTVVQQRLPKWRALVSLRKLGQEITTLKTEASLKHRAYLIRFTNENELRYVVEEKSRCKLADQKEIRSGSIETISSKLLNSAEGLALGVPGIVSQICVDPIDGVMSEGVQSDLSGFAIIPVKDLTDSPPSLDRISILLIKGKQGEIQIH